MKEDCVIWPETDRPLGLVQQKPQNDKRARRANAARPNSVPSDWLIATTGQLLRALCAIVLLLSLPLSSTADRGFFSGNPIREIVILHTNDFESAFDPIPAYWRNDVDYLGGGAHLAALVERIREDEETVFLFDAGDMFTGLLSNRTRGELLMEMMISMRYDAMAVGNHEFDYGWENFRRQMNRVPFPILGANIFYRGTDIPYTRPYAIIERGGVRIGVIGVIGLDARSVVMPSNVEGLDFSDPKIVVQEAVEQLRPAVDLIVVLAHQGQTAPMQTDAEARPEIQRNLEADLALAGAVPGIDILIGGHADRGTEEPVVHADTGTLVVQTYGHGTRLGQIKLKVDTEKDEIVSYEGRLLVVESARLKPFEPVVEKIDRYRARYPDIFETRGRLKRRLVREYNAESSLGNFVTDVMRELSGTDLAFVNAGGLRADLPSGSVTMGDVLDAFPFTDRIVLLEMRGRDILAVLEQAATLERGMLQVSGLVARYSLSKPVGHRILSVEIGGQPLEPNRAYRVAVPDILAQGSDLYTTFLNAEVFRESAAGPKLHDGLLMYFSLKPEPDHPKGGRLIAVADQ